MCRLLSYLGLPVSVEELLYITDNSFIKQSYHPRHMSHLLNLAGFGMMAWDHHSSRPDLPFIYKTMELPFYDDNLRSLSRKINANCILAHLRGVPFIEKQIVSSQNVHPFIFEGTHFALAHNGALIEFEKMKFDLLEHIKPEYRAQIHGTTDSEHIYALFLSQLANPDTHTPAEVAQALINTLTIIKDIRHKLHIEINSPINLFISNGKLLAATRFVFDYGWHPPISKDLAHFSYHSLWYTYGENYGLHNNEYSMRGSDKKLSLIIASEPLTEDTTTWIEVPEYSLIVATHEAGEIKIISQDLNL